MKKPILKIVLIIVTLLMMMLFAFAVNSSKSKKNMIYMPDKTSAYDWDALDRSNDEQAKAMEVSRISNISRVYIDLSGIVEFYDQPAVDTQGLQRYFAKINRLQEHAKRNGIQVSAVIGNPKWHNPDLRYLNLLAIKGVSTYNENFPESTINVIEFDIEPHNDPAYTSAQNAWQSYIEMMTEIMNNRPANFTFGFTIPFWLDCTSDEIPSKNGECFTTQINKILKENSNNSYVTIMAYRNTLYGEDGALTLAYTERELFSSSKVPVRIAQEFTNVTPSKQTYYSVSDEEAMRNLKIIREQFPDGIMIHDLQAVIDRYNFPK